MLKNILKTKAQPSQIMHNRALLRRRQTLNFKVAKKLPSDPSLLEKPISDLKSLKKPECFGSFVSRCSEPSLQRLNFLADMNIKAAMDINPNGIPFTVKDHLRVCDLIQTCGYSHNVMPSSQNTEIVDILIREGCVPYAHTNVPQGLLNIESNNHVYGLSRNPYNRAFGSGGSSGGEGGAISTRCAAFGISSDTAGSARIPASFCGNFGFKPTGGKRLSTKGRLGVSGRPSVIIGDLDTSLGFSTRNIEDLAWLCKKTIGKTIRPTPYILNPWKDKKYQEKSKKKLKFGYMIKQKEMQIAPAIKNAILETVQGLRREGHEVVEWDFEKLTVFRDFIFKFLVNTSFISTIPERLGGEEHLPQNQMIMQRGRYGQIGTYLRKLLSFSKQERDFYEMWNISTNTLDLLKQISLKEDTAEDFHKSWQNSGIDALISPVTPFTAPLVNSHHYLLNQLYFCCFQNVLQLPAGTVPIRLVKREQTNYQDCGFYGGKIKRSIELSQGLPVGIQVTTQHMEDQLCVAAMKHVSKLFPPVPRPQPSNNL